MRKLGFIFLSFFLLNSSPLLSFAENTRSFENPVNGDEIFKRLEAWVPVRPITRGPGFHWFGYYDKLQFDETGRYVLGMEVHSRSLSWP